ncbi:MAG: DUF4105 domain-containing protein [Candidatus Riflebacteria bacterium]|nr:DUF4105 domain-containing protein [Candidatus Riflebacteria bacterium]
MTSNENSSFLRKLSMVAGSFLALFIFSFIPCCALASSEVVTSDHGFAERAFLISDNSGLLKIGNVRWGVKGKNPEQTPPEEHEFFWKDATIRPELVEKIYFMVKPFTPKIIAGHGYSVMLFKSGGIKGSEGSTPEGIVVSYEIFKQPGMKIKDIDFVYKATHDYYEVAPIVATWEDYVMADCGLGKHELLPYEITFTREQMIKFAESMLRAAASWQAHKEFYHTLKNSCVTKQVQGINSVIPDNQQIDPTLGQTKILNANGFVPKLIAKTFEKKGIMSKCEPSITSKNFFIPLRKLLTTAKDSK